MSIKEKITAAITEILNEQSGFEIYVLLKKGEILIKKFVLDEGKPTAKNSFKNKIKSDIKEVIIKQFVNEDCEYSDVADLANEQKRIYEINQDESYCPFKFLSTTESLIDNFSLNDKDNADAFLFKFSFQRKGILKQLWGYQKIRPTSIPNRKRHFFQLIPKLNRLDIFEELKDQMFVITKKIDLLVINEKILTNDIGLLERHFGFETFIRSSAKKAVLTIMNLKIIKNEQKLIDFVQRPSKRYAQKMMQIHKFPVATMNKEILFNKLNSIERWKDAFKIQDGQFYLRNFADVELLIDLFTERYTKSEVSGQEYDTSVKEKALPINQQNSK